jgi:NAD-dependent SIR2 family protein deacetylase
VEEKGDYFVYTSNIDGHFIAAKFDEKKVVEKHGSVHFLQCSNPCSQDLIPALLEVV